MELKINKDRVLEAAKACPSSEPVLKTLFPEAFELDTLAIKKDVFTEEDMDLSNFCIKAFGDKDAIQITFGAIYYLDPTRNDLRGRSLYVGKKYDVESLKLGSDLGTIIVLKHKL